MSVNVTALSIRVKSEGIKEASQQLGGLSTSANNATKRVLALEKAMQNLDKVNANSAKVMGNFMTQMQQQVNLMRSLETHSKGATASTSSLAAAMALLATSLNNLSAHTTQATVAQSKHNQGMREAHGLARGLSGSLGALWLTYGNLAGMAVGVGIGATLKSIITIGADVEHTLAGIRVRGQESTESIDKMREALFGLSRGVYGPQEVANAFQTLILAGLKAEQAMSSVTAALSLATVGGTSIEKSAETLVSVGSSIGYAAEGYSRISDVIAKTAALSMSSVETLSEAFKSASSVSKLYGVSLEDVATSLGVLSNLGIQGSAAGTALKNMYKELASEADKVQNTFKKMGVGALALKDAAGNFRPMLTVVGELDVALKKLPESEEKLAIARLSNERGMRLMVQALDLYRKKLAEGGNALQKFREEVENSYAFAAMGAIDMSLTAKSQMDSVMNSLKTTFAETFKSMEPQIILFSNKMKEVFASEGFKNAVKGLAEAFGNMALAVANNIDMLASLAKWFVIIKTGLMITSAVNALSVSLGVLTTALAGLRAGTISLATVFPPLAIAIGITTAAYLAYRMAFKESEAEKSAAMASAHSKNVIEGMKKEAEQLRKNTDLIKQGMDVNKAAKEVERADALQEMVRKNRLAIAAAEEQTEKSRRANNLGAYKDGLEKLAALRKTTAAAEKDARDARAMLDRDAKAHAAAIEEQAKKKGDGRKPTNTLGGEPDKGAVNDAYQAAIIKQLGIIKAAKRDLAAEEDRLNMSYKAGEIGKMGMLDLVAAKQIETNDKIQKALQAQLAAALGKGDQSEIQRYQSEIINQKEAFANQELSIEKEKQLALHEYARTYAQMRMGVLEAEGSYSVAATMRFEAQYGALMAQAKADKDKIPQAAQLYDVLVQKQKEMVSQGVFKERIKEYDLLFATIQNGIKGVQTATEGQGMVAMWGAASKATEDYKTKLVELKAKSDELGRTAKTDEEKTKHQESLAAQTRLTENVKTMWDGVGESITKSLEKAFGKGGKAVGEMMKISKRYELEENKSQGAKLKYYGDLAGAAAGFFDEESKGHKILMNLSRAMHVAQMAMMITELPIKAALAKLMFFAQSGWGGFAGVAAMAAMVGLSVAGGGGGPSPEDRQKQSGSGSVLGDKDAKSESIANSLSILEKNSGLGLAHNETMIRHLQTVANGMSNLAKLVVQTTGINGQVSGVEEGYKKNLLSATIGGGVVGLVASFIPGLDKIMTKLFGTKTSVVDQGITASSRALGDIQDNGFSGGSYADVNTKKKFLGLSYSDKTKQQLTPLSDELNTQFGLIINSLADTIKSASNLLGVGGDAFNEKLKHFVIDIGNISTKGLSGEEIEKQFQAVFSKLGDDMAKFALDGLSSFQRIGEGYLETLARVANDLIQVKDVFAVMGQSLNLTGMNAIEVSQSLIAAAGSLEKLTEGTKYFVDNFLTEAEKMAPITASVNKRLAELNMSELTTVDLYKKKVLALDLTNKADQELYAALIELAPAFKQVADHAKGAKDATEIGNKMRELEIRLMEAQGKTAQALAARRGDELAALAKLDPALAALQAQIYDVEDKAKALSDAKSDLKVAYDRESAALQGVVTKFDAFSKSLKKFKDSLLTGDLSTMSPEQKYLESKRRFESTSALAAGGNADALAELEKVSQEFLEQSRGYNASTEAYTKDFNLVQKVLTSGIAAADKQVSIAEAQLAVMKAQASSLLELNKNFKTFAEAMSMATKASNDYSNVGGVTGGGSIAAGGSSMLADVKAYGAKNGMDAYYLNGVNNFEAKVASATNVANQLGGTLDHWMGAGTKEGGLDYWANVQAQFDAGMAPKANGSVSSSISGANKGAVEAIYKSVLGRDSDAAGLSYWAAKLEQGTATVDQIKAAIAGSPEAIDGSHFNGLDKVPFDGYVAKLHKDERVQTAKAANASDENSAELVKLTRELLTRISNMEEHAAASNVQRSAVAEMQGEQLAAVVDKLDEVKRKVAVK